MPEPADRTGGNRAFLRSATRAAHTQAERAFVGPAGFADLAGYRTWLRAMLTVHIGIGRPSARILGDTHLLAMEDARISALTDDLDVPFGADRSPLGESESWAWGVQYVLNGSALGASVLTKSGRVKGAWPRSYIVGMAAYARGGHLSRFFQRLDAAVLDPEDALKGATCAYPVLVPSAH